MHAADRKTATGVTDTLSEANLWQKRTFSAELQWGVPYSQSDPLGLFGGLNTFAYSDGNPKRLIDPFGLAYFAKRPLDGAPWLGPLSGQRCSGLDIANVEFSHEHLFFEDFATNPNAPTNLGLFTDGRVRVDFGWPMNRPKYRKSSGHYNDCIMRMAVDLVGDGYYNFVGVDIEVFGHEVGPRTAPGPKFNCQDWSSTVRGVYHELKLKPEVKRKCECESSENIDPWWNPGDHGRY